MLHPLLVDHLLDRYGDSGDVTMDPFCGSGVTILQGILRGYDVIGFDINPTALLISKAKAETYDENTLSAEFEDLRRTIESTSRSDVPYIKNVSAWYDPRIVVDLGKIRHTLKIKSYRYSSFFTACFALVCRNQSFTRNGEFKRYRMHESKRLCMKNKVLAMFLTHTARMIEIFL